MIKFRFQYLLCTFNSQLLLHFFFSSKRMIQVLQKNDYLGLIDSFEVDISLFDVAALRGHPTSHINVSSFTSLQKRRYILKMINAFHTLLQGWMRATYSISTACITSNFSILNAANHIIDGDAEAVSGQWCKHSFKC